MFKSLRLIDFNQSNLLSDTITIGIVLPGVFSFSDLKDMFFDDYENLLIAVKNISKELKNAKRR